MALATFDYIWSMMQPGIPNCFVYILAAGDFGGHDWPNHKPAGFWSKITLNTDPTKPQNYSLHVYAKENASNTLSLEQTVNDILYLNPKTKM